MALIKTTKRYIQVGNNPRRLSFYFGLELQCIHWDLSILILERKSFRWKRQNSPREEEIHLVLVFLKSFSFLSFF